MESRRQRLERLMALQNGLKRLHEMRQAGHLAQAAAAEEEARELSARFDAGEGTASLFPELYHRRIAGAHARRAESVAAAEAEAKETALARLRLERIEGAWREARRWEERAAEERERLDLIERRVADPGGRQ